MRKKEPEKLSEYTLEHVKSQFSGGVPPDPPHTLWGPLFIFALGPHNPLGDPDQSYDKTTLTQTDMVIVSDTNGETNKKTA